MPSLGADMDAGTITEWLVKPGDAVKRGDIVAVVETDKADVEVEIVESGVIGELLVPAGEKVAVGTPLATVRVAEAEPPPPPAPRGPAEAEARRRVSPRARRRARELGVDVAGVPGIGPAGAVTSADVEKAGEQPAREEMAPAPLAAARSTRERAAKAAAIRQAIGALMARSKREIPHYYLGTHVDMSGALAWLEAENGRRGVADRILPAALVLRAVALTARDVPELNGFWIGDAFHPGDGIHLGVAVSLREGALVAPAIHDADRKDLGTLMAELRDLVTRARAGRLRSSEMSDPTITVTNLGDQGVETVYGVIYPPQVALVGVGKVVERPWARDGMVGVRPVLHLTLAADHRASDGHRGGRFLAAVDRRLQEPEQL